MSTSPGPRHEPGLTTPLVGRESELELIARLLGDPEVRLVTVFGPGGVGKTRLALEAVRRLDAGTGTFPNGSVWVPLAGISEPSLIAPAIAAALSGPAAAQALGGAFGGRAESWADLEGFLGSRRLLLVLDNFEHLLDGAGLVVDMLEAAPGLKILVTSREKLDLSLETRLRLEGLESQPEDAATLFLVGARRARPGYEPSAEDLAAIASVCRLVEGLPLAILLAASWMDSLTPAEIAHEIKRSLDFLSARWPDVPPRHRSLRAVFDSTWSRLEDCERRVFSRLCVFQDGFSGPAAEAVAGASLEVLGKLVAKGLLRREGGEGRYDLHEVARKYAREKLDEEPGEEIRSVLDRHRDYYLSWLAGLQPVLLGPRQVQALDDIASCFENVRLAWVRAVKTGDHEGIDRSRDALYQFFDMRTRNRAGETLFGLVRESWRSESNLGPAWARSLLPWYDMYLQGVGPMPPAAAAAVRAEAERGREAARRDGDLVTGASCSVLLGALALSARDYASAVSLFKAGLEQHPALDDPYWVRLRLGVALRGLGRPADALAWFGKALERGRELGEKIRIAWALTNAGETHMLLGALEAARADLEEAEALFEAVGNPMGQVWVLADLGQIALAGGESQAALDLTERARKLAETHQYRLAGWRRTLVNLFQASRALGNGSRAEAALDVLRREFPEALASLARKALEPVGAQGHQGRVARSEGRSEGLAEPLTAREREVLVLISEGLSNEEIARRLVVALSTVKTHLIHINGKLQASSRTQAVARAREMGLL